MTGCWRCPWLPWRQHGGPDLIPKLRKFLFFSDGGKSDHEQAWPGCHNSLLSWDDLGSYEQTSVGLGDLRSGRHKTTELHRRILSVTLLRSPTNHKSENPIYTVSALGPDLAHKVASRSASRNPYLRESKAKPRQMHPNKAVEVERRASNCRNDVSPSSDVQMSMLEDATTLETSSAACMVTVTFEYFGRPKPPARRAAFGFKVRAPQRGPSCSESLLETSNANCLHAWSGRLQGCSGITYCDLLLQRIY